MEMLGYEKGKDCSCQDSRISLTSGKSADENEAGETRSGQHDHKYQFGQYNNKNITITRRALSMLLTIIMRRE